MDKNDAHSNKLLVVNTVQERIGSYVAQIIKDKKLNYREIARRANNQISHSAVGDIINGRVKDIRVETLQALAKGLGVPEDDLLAVAFGKKGERGVLESRLLHCFRDLPLDRQQILVLIAEALIGDQSFEEADESLVGQKLEIIGTGKPNPKN